MPDIYIYNGETPPPPKGGGGRQRRRSGGDKKRNDQQNKPKKSKHALCNHCHKRHPGTPDKQNCYHWQQTEEGKIYLAQHPKATVALRPKNSAPQSQPQQPQVTKKKLTLEEMDKKEAELSKMLEELKELRNTTMDQS